MRFAIVTWKEMSPPERIGLLAISAAGFGIGMFGSLDQNQPARAVAEPAVMRFVVEPQQHQPPARPDDDSLAIFARGWPMPRYAKEF